MKPAPLKTVPLKPVSLKTVPASLDAARPNPDFWAGKRVLLTGHTGFKGAWAARMLDILGARVTGFALAPVAGPSAYLALGVSAGLARDLRGDLRNAAAVARAAVGADIVLHLGAQAIVSQGYRDPVATWACNVTGTQNVLQALGGSNALAVVIVTSDKVYRNDSAPNDAQRSAQVARARGFVETDPLGGDDPYSASKAACELLCASHRASFAHVPPLATARAGNVIGGGDFGRDRLIPDLVRAKMEGRALMLRSPDATRPFQHVFDVLAGYLLLAERLAEAGPEAEAETGPETGAGAGDACAAADLQSQSRSLRGALRQTAPQAVNFGPAEAELSVRDLLVHWGNASAAPPHWELSDAPPMPEKSRLALDSSLAQACLNWRARLGTAQAVAQTAQWYVAWARGADMAKASNAALQAFLEG